MAYSDVQTAFLSVLNRNDITPTQMQTFLQAGARRISREMTVPAMERILTYTTDGSASLAIPNNYLSMISLNTNDVVNNLKLERCDLQTILTLMMIPGVPTNYYRNANAFLIGPYPPAGTQVYLSYIADGVNLSAATDTSWLTETAPDLLYYAGLTYASDYFLDERAKSFEDKYQMIKMSIQNMADNDELVNASIAPCYDVNYSQYYPYANY